MGENNTPTDLERCGVKNVQVKSGCILTFMAQNFEVTTKQTLGQMQIHLNAF